MFTFVSEILHAKKDEQISKKNLFVVFLANRKLTQFQENSSEAHTSGDSHQQMQFKLVVIDLSFRRSTNSWDQTLALYI